MSRLPYEEQKTEAAAEIYACLEEALVTFDAAIAKLSYARENVRIKMNQLKERCPEVTAQWRGPIAALIEDPLNRDSYGENDDVPPAA